SGITMLRGAAARDRFLDGRTMIIAGDAAKKVVVYPISGQAERRGRSLVNWVAEIHVGGDRPPRPSDWWAEGVRSHFVPQFEDWDLGFVRMADLFDATEDVYEFPMVDRDPLPRWSFGRVTLLGDAAHAMYPMGANGASQAIIDAHALAEAVAASGSAQDALSSYQRQRLVPTTRVVLANRRRGPEWILEVAKQRLPTPDAEPGDYLSEQEALSISRRYQALAGFDIDTLNREGL
ncbi:MAG: FAD-dependent monooxygenase, partial [Rhodospirillaceae bacterium]|nr:FAD-dependent monooxygenase [Rhodospirillaceae bacterium]